MKILKNSKALSPVVASIILIAVTVAVSIAVAAWMGALSFNLMGTEQITFTSYTWASDSTYIDITVKNTGSSDLSIQDVRLDGNVVLTNFTSSQNPLVKGEPVPIRVTPILPFNHGVQYEFTVLTLKGNTFGPYIKTAP